MGDPPVDSKVFEAIKELIVTEYKYVKSLKLVSNLFGKPLCPSSMSPFHIISEDQGNPPSLSHHDWHLIFSKTPQLICLHESILGHFLQALNIFYNADEELDFSKIQFSHGISLGELGNIFLKHVSVGFMTALGPAIGHLCFFLWIPNVSPSQAAGNQILQFWPRPVFKGTPCFGDRYY